MVQIYKEPLCRRYYSDVSGDAVIFRVVAYLGAIVLALVVAFATGGFWIKIKPVNVQGTVHYTYDALLIFEGAAPGQEMVWSTSDRINDQFTSQYVSANVEVAELDYNNDGKPDVIDFRATVAGGSPVHGVKALLQFTYSLTGSLKLDMYSLAYLAYSSPLQGGALYTDGELQFIAKNQPTDRRYNTYFNVPLLNTSRPLVAAAVQPTAELELQSILSSYLDRNYTTMYTNNYPVWQSGTADSFSLTMRIRIPPNQVIHYRPQVIEMLKGGWIQWVATFIVLWYLLQWAEWFAFTNKFFTVRVVSDLQPKNQRF